MAFLVDNTTIVVKSKISDGIFHFLFILNEFLCNWIIHQFPENPFLKNTAAIFQVSSYNVPMTLAVDCDSQHDDVTNGNIFRVTGHLWVESTGHRWISLTNASDAEFWYFRWSAPEQTIEQTIETPVIWEAIALIMTSQ